MADEMSDTIGAASEEGGRGGLVVLMDSLEMAEHRKLSGLRHAFLGAIGRLEQIIDLETATLRQHSPVDLRDFNHKKSHGLLEMTRAMRAMETLSSDAESLASIERLRGKLEKNLQVLESHLRAVKKVSGIIARVIEADDSDGTYSATGYKSAQKP